MINLFKRGYTLIELLIVIAIIGILTAILTTNLQSVRARARDTRRKQDLSTIQQALRLYYHDNQSFPVTANTTWNTSATITYLSTIPTDPSSTPTSPIPYNYVSDGTTYILYASLENTSDPDLADSQARCSGEPADTYVVCEQ